LIGKRYNLLVRAEDDDYYYVWSFGRELPHDLLMDMTFPGKVEYEGKIPKNSPDFVFLEEDSE